MIHYVLLAVTVAVLAAASWIAYFYTRDPFHPQLVMAPMFATIYVYLPGSALMDGQVFRFLLTEQMQYTQLLFLCGVTAFSVGCLHRHSKRKTIRRFFNCRILRVSA